MGSTIWAETVSRSQSGRILEDVFTDPDGVADPTTYTYDPLGRLTVAELSDQTLTYGFGEVTGCSGANNEPSAGLNGNRTSQTRTVDGVSTTDIYCYDTGDRLTSASQVNGSVVYDAHGNITQLGDTSFTYDSLDRHVSTVLPTGQVVSLERNIDGSVLTRTVTSPNQPVEVVKYSVGVVQFYLNSNNQVTGTTQSLPGGVSVTDANSTSTTTFTSLHGNAGLTVSAAGTTRTRFDPFGTPLTALPDTLPGSAEAGFGTVAGKLTDTLSAFGLIEMGARLYSTVLGRFLQVDPVPGGGVNAYAYPPDPVNMNDYSGMVGTADSYSAWRSHKVNPTKDGNLRAQRISTNGTIFGHVQDFARSNVGGTARAVLEGLSLALWIAAFAFTAAACALCLVVAGAVSTAGLVVGAASTTLTCTAEGGSFGCVAGVATLGLGGVGRASSLFAVSHNLAETNGAAGQLTKLGVGIGRMGDNFGAMLSASQVLSFSTGRP